MIRENTLAELATTHTYDMAPASRDFPWIAARLRQERARLQHEIALAERDEANARDKAKALREQQARLGR